MRETIEVVVWYLFLVALGLVGVTFVVGYIVGLFFRL